MMSENKCTIDYRKGRYYVERYKSPVYADMLIVKMEGYWRNLFTTGDADGKAMERCQEWISRRRCFNQ